MIGVSMASTLLEAVGLILICTGVFVLAGTGAGLVVTGGALVVYAVALDRRTDT